MPHLYVAISPHGYGHAAMTAPVLNRLRTRIPALRLTLETNVPAPWLHSRITGPFDIVPTRDFGMVMHHATDVDPGRSAAAYAALHADWPVVVADSAARLQAIAPDLVFANVPYLTLAGAAAVGVPSVALCSLNWAGIFRRYCADQPGADRVLADMEAAYATARPFLRPTPAMPMPCIPGVRTIGPLCRIGTDRRDEVRRWLKLDPGVRIGLVAFGGIDPALAPHRWPRHPGWVWISGQERVPDDRSDMVAAATLPVSFLDLVWSADVIVSKPGYGTFTEAACAGTPVLYAVREDWPEEPHLSTWLKGHVPAIGLPSERLRDGDFGDAVERLVSLPRGRAATPTGIDEAVDVLAGHLG